jgi:thioredoxin
MRKMKLVLAALTFLVSFQLAAGVPGANSKHPDEEKSETAVIKMTKADFLAKVMDYENNPTEWVFKGDKPCVIDFYADWCGPCRITSPILEELAQEYKGKINVYKVNVDYEKELSQVFGISGIPAFLYCPMEGKPSMTSGIARDRDQTKQMFKDNIEKLLLNK